MSVLVSIAVTLLVVVAIAWVLAYRNSRPTSTIAVADNVAFAIGDVLYYSTANNEQYMRVEDADGTGKWITVRKL